MIKHIISIDDNELEQIMRIWLNSNIDTHSFISSDYWINNIPLVKKMLPKSEIYVINRNNKILGFIGLTDNYISGIFIDKSYRSHGLGSKLLHKVKKEHSQLQLSVYKKNIKAYQFYIKQGFKVINTSIDLKTKEKELLMCWEK